MNGEFANHNQNKNDIFTSIIGKVIFLPCGKKKKLMKQKIYMADIKIWY